MAPVNKFIGFQVSTHNATIVICVKMCIDRKCLLTALGSDYMGTTNESILGQACEYWNNTFLPTPYMNVIKDMNTILRGSPTAFDNACRNVDYDDNGPWCYNSLQQRMSCFVDYCGRWY
jgi:hypothetical protein